MRVPQYRGHDNPRLAQAIQARAQHLVRGRGRARVRLRLRVRAIQARAQHLVRVRARVRNRARLRLRLRLRLRRRLRVRLRLRLRLWPSKLARSTARVRRPSVVLLSTAEEEAHLVGVRG